VSLKRKRPFDIESINKTRGYLISMTWDLPLEVCLKLQEASDSSRARVCGGGLMFVSSNLELWLPKLRVLKPAHIRSFPGCLPLHTVNIFYRASRLSA